MPRLNQAGANSSAQPPAQPAPSLPYAQQPVAAAPAPPVQQYAPPIQPIQPIQPMVPQGAPFDGGTQYAPPVIPPVAPQGVVQAPSMPIPDATGIDAALQQLTSSDGDLDLTALDLSAVSEGGRILDETLDYEGCIEGAEIKSNQAGDGKMLSFKLKDTFPPSYVGATLYDQASFKEGGIWKFKSVARASELLSADGSKFIGTSAKDFDGSIVRFKIKHDEWNGKITNKVLGGYEPGKDTPGLS